MANFFERLRQRKNAKKIIPVILVLDGSDRMSAENFELINSALAAAVEEYAAYNLRADGEDRIRLAILQYSDLPRWIGGGLTEPDGLRLPLASSFGKNNLGAALSELNSGLSKEKLFSDPAVATKAHIFFIIDSMPDDNWFAPLKALEQNGFYHEAEKHAIATSLRVSRMLLTELVGSLDSFDRLDPGKDLISRVNTIRKMLTSVVARSAYSPAAPQPIPAASFPGASRPESAPRPTAAYSVPTPPKQSSFHRTESRADLFDPDEFAPAMPGSSGVNIFDDCAPSAFSAPRGCSSSAWSEADDFSKTMNLSDLFVPFGDGQPSYSMPSPPPPTSSYAPPPAPMPAYAPAPREEGMAGHSFCPVCGSVVASGALFCSTCGTRVTPPAPPKVNVTQVQFSAVVPKRFVKGEYAMIDIAVYEELYRRVVESIIDNADGEVREVLGGFRDIEDRTEIRIRLFSPDLDLSDCEEAQTWRGKYLTFSFPVEIPEDYAKKQILFIANVYFNDLIATKLKFVANCSSGQEQRLRPERQDVLRAFISYASQDRSRVATIIQGMQKARPDMDIFFDVESLRSGQYWERALQEEIESRDVLFLCWSNFARDSAWVEKEWRYALRNKGLDAIEPIPLVSPAECPPPQELSAKSFNDRALLYQKY